MSNPIRFGLVGYKFMGKAHSNALARLPMFFPGHDDTYRQVLCGRDEKGVAAAARKLGFAAYETDWQKLIARDDVDVIDITAPSNAHKEIALAALAAGKHVFCEKPLALNLADAREMAAAAKASGCKAQIGFNYRFAPAILLARQLIESGKLGTIYHFRGQYLQDFILDPNFPLVWRLDKAVCGSGALGDLGAHVIDLARFLVGDLARVCAQSKTFITERPLPSDMAGLSGQADTKRRGKVEVDDATSFISEFAGGALGVFEATRFAAGHKNALTFEINGSQGSLRFDLERLNELEFYSTDDDPTSSGFRTIQVTESEHPYLEAWWPAGHIIGYEHTFVHEMHEFIRSIREDRPTCPDFNDGVKASQIIEAVEIAAKEKRWVEVESL